MSHRMAGRQARIALALGLLAGAVLLTGPLKASLAAHILLQFPALVGAGALLGASAPRAPGRATGDGAAALVLAGLCLGFWMLPRWLDAAVGDPRADAAKIAALVLLAGVPLGWGWRRLGPVARAFVWANVVSMLAILGALYVAFPERLCNNYLVDEQALLGRLMLLIALLLGLAGAARALAGTPGGAGQG